MATNAKQITHDKLLNNSKFLRIWLASLFSGLSVSIYLLLEQWYIVNHLDLNKYLGIIMMATTLPRVLLMAFGGVLADRNKKTTIVFLSLLTRFILLLLMALLFEIGLLKIAPLFIFALLFGALDAFFWPARDSLMPSLIHKEQLIQANSFIQTTNQMSMVLGPVLGALLIKNFSYTIGFISIAFLLLIGAVLIFSVKEAPNESSQKSSSFIQDLLEGFKYVLESKFLIAIMITFIMTNLFFIGPLMLSIPLYADEKFGGEPFILSVLQSTFALGMVTGALLMGFLKIKVKRGSLIIGLLFLEGIALLLYSQLVYFWLSAIFLFIIGMAISSVNIPVISLVQETVVEDKLGRILSLMTMVSMGLIPISYALVSGLLNYNIDIVTILAIASSLIIALSIILFAKGTSLKEIN
ncbi:MFS transporter [Bacillus sp. CECT 9360]|uniref:MFS transporter n=1 Tax=Bacillus sp. CECT 9360 TaxID=2845821 RepID=UPI001E4FA846|nr:MFS transporter [Bacillus sp. CECT 9360]CAH0346685.1 Enterobactin exporter EntS [Bacillus sp. CECT 9360]